MKNTFFRKLPSRRPQIKSTGSHFYPIKIYFRIVVIMPEPENEAIRHEFNRWAETGRGEGMEEEHLPIVPPVLDQMNLAPGRKCPRRGQWHGVARADDRRASARRPGDWLGHFRRNGAPGRSRNYVAVENTMFVVGSVVEIPWDANFFTRAISVESAYYWPDPGARLAAKFTRAPREGGIRVGSDQFLSR